MKLYTEEQVRQMLSIYMANVLLDVDGKMTTVDEILSYRTPIELPSDEEIEKYIEKTFYGVKKHYFKAGVEFMKELILKQNK
jgi:hypothetical protein